MAPDETRTAAGEIAAADETMVTTTALTNGSAMNSGAEEKSHGMSGSQRTMLLHEGLPKK
jgi:hypothetical protein